MRHLAMCLCAGLVLAGCGAAGAEGPFSNSGQAVMIVIARQPVYTRASCTEESGTTLDPGASVIDLGTKGTNCEQVAYVVGGVYGGIGYLPVYGMRRAAGGVRCRADSACHLRAGPGTRFDLIGTLAPGASAKGYGTSQTGAIITDGMNLDWWEVVDPVTGRRADIFGPNCQVF